MIRRHHFHLSLRINPGAPPAFVDRFTGPGRQSFEAVFAARAQRYRLTTRIVVLLLVGFGVGMLAAVKLPVPEASRARMALLSAALLLLAVFVHFLNRRLRCPRCRKALTPAKGRYCPQCGAEEYQAGLGRCEDCGGRIEEETGEDARSYRVRGCTHCGVFLDERGL